MLPTCSCTDLFIIVIAFPNSYANSQQRRHLYMYTHTHTYVYICMYARNRQIKERYTARLLAIMLTRVWHLRSTNKDRSEQFNIRKRSMYEKAEQKLNRKCKCKGIKNVLSLFILRHTHRQKSAYVCVYV